MVTTVVIHWSLKGKLLYKRAEFGQEIFYFAAQGKNDALLIQNAYISDVEGV